MRFNAFKAISQRRFGDVMLTGELSFRNVSVIVLIGFNS